MVAAAAYAVWRAFDTRRADSKVTWQPQPFPYPPVPNAPTTEPATPPPPPAPPAPLPAWVEPEDGACPAGHPVKAKLSSGIFHVPGGANYERTRPDRCYTSPEAAEGDGLRAAKA